MKFSESGQEAPFPIPRTKPRQPHPKPNVATDTHPRTAEGRCIECAPGEVGEFIGMILELPDSGAGRFEGYPSPAAPGPQVLHDVWQPGARRQHPGRPVRPPRGAMDIGCAGRSMIRAPLRLAE